MCINFNTEKIKNTVNSFKKDFFQSMINSVYSKTMRNLGKVISDKIVNKDFLKYVSKRTFISFKIFDKNYAPTHEIKPVLTLNKYVNLCWIYCS